MIEPLEFYGSAVILGLLLAAVLACSVKMHAIEREVGVLWTVKMKYVVFKFWLGDLLIKAGKRLR